MAENGRMNQIERDPFWRLCRFLRYHLGENAEEKFLAWILVPLLLAPLVLP